MLSSKILVVDDEPEMLALLNEWLEEDGHEVATASNGWDALEIFIDRKPALTITDLRMPGMDGFQLIRRIREISNTLVIALTAMQWDPPAHGDEKGQPSQYGGSRKPLADNLGDVAVLVGV